MTKLSDVLLEDAEIVAQQLSMRAERAGHFVPPTPLEMKLMWRVANGRRLSRAEADSTRSSITGY
jgi:hypothetical protein